MKKLHLLGAMALLLGACTSAPKEYKLTGTLAGTPGEYALISYGPNSVASADTVPIAADGSFSYTCTLRKPSTGFIYVPDKAFYQLVMINGTTTHLKANTDNPLDVSFTGDLAEAQAFYKAANEIVQKRCEATFDSFSKMQAAFAALSDSIELAAKKISPKEFATLIKDEMAMSFRSNELGYSNRLAATGKAVDSDADYNRYMEALDMNNGGLAMTYIRWRENCINLTGAPDYLRMLNLAEEKIKDPNVLGKVALDLITGYFYVADASIDAIYNKAISLIKDEKPREWVKETYEAVKKTAPGSPAIDCPLEATDGSMRNLSALYGKVLYIDVWATWCGPCCEETPYMAKLAEHFKGDKRIELVSISVDRDKKAWKKMLQEEKPQWAQYLCQNFTNLYGITGIPCFILIDKEGKIITMNAPRPSQPDAIEIISKHLN